MVELIRVTAVGIHFYVGTAWRWLSAGSHSFTARPKITKAVMFIVLADYCPSVLKPV